MRYLWNLAERWFGQKRRVGVFLALNIVSITLGTFAAGLIFCAAAGQLTVHGGMASVMCIAAYAGIIFGLFGGIFYVMRNRG